MAAAVTVGDREQQQQGEREGGKGEGKRKIGAKQRSLDTAQAESSPEHKVPQRYIHEVQQMLYQSMPVYLQSCAI